MIYRDEYTHRFNVRPDPWARLSPPRAVPSRPRLRIISPIMLWPAAQFFRREFQAFRNSAERAIALNPMDGFTAAYLGLLIAYSGDWERGCALAERARGLNPAPSRMVLVSLLFRRLPQRRLPRRAGHCSQDQHAWLLANASCPRNCLRPTRRTGGGMQRCAGVARCEAGLRCDAREGSERWEPTSLSN